jgi:hypothetical protein
MRYQSLEEIGRGGSGIVYRGFDPQMNRAVALKRIDRWTEADREALRESSRLLHPNIVKTYETWEDEGALWVANQLCDFSLADRPPDPLSVWTVAKCVASALVHAHGRGILHRDLKPSNVLGLDGVYLLSDFGALGKLLDTGLTVSGEIAGTLLYMSPEQALGRPQTVQSDVFGLGLLLYWCVLREVPNQQEELFGVLRARASEQITVPRHRFQDPILTPALGQLIQSCLELDPQRRPSNVAVVLDQLRSIRRFPDADLGIAPSPAIAVPAAPAPPSPAVSITIQSGRPELPPPLPEASPLPAAARWWTALLLIVCGVLALVVWSTHFVLGSPGGGPGRGLLARLALALRLTASGFAAARWIRSRTSPASPATQHRATEILFGAGQRGDLTTSLLIQVDQVVSNLKAADAGIVGLTIRAMVHEYEAGRSSSDRQQALMNVVALMEKIETRLAPWHIRHKEAIATTTALIGCLSGVASAVSGFLK